MNPLSCRHWLLHESKVDNLLILFFQLGNCIKERKAENDHTFLCTVWGKTQKKSMESLCDDLVFLSVTVWCLFFLLKEAWFSYLQKDGEKTSQYCNIYNECDILLHSWSQNGEMQQKRVQMELCLNELQGLFPLFSTQHNTLSSCHDEVRTFTMQHRHFRWVEQTDRNIAWLFLAFAHK